MNDFVDQLEQKTGIDHNTAMKVVNFIKENAEHVPNWLGQLGVADKLPGGLGKTFGGKQ